MKHNQPDLDKILEAYRKDCQRTDDHVEGGMHLSKDQAKEAILALIEKEKIEARIDELEKVKELDEPADYEQDGKKWTGLAIPRNKVINRIQELKALQKGDK